MRQTRRHSISIISAVALLAAAIPVSAQASIARVAWLSGCWQMKRGNSTVEERWSSAAGGVLLNAGKTIRNDSLIEYEFVRVYARGDTLVYDAHPSGQAPAEFRALPPFEPAITFANPQHDFPQRLIYRVVGTDSM